MHTYFSEVSGAFLFMPEIMFTKDGKISGYKKMVDGGHMRKKRIMDGCKLRQCSAILNKLMSHPVGWVFNQPVDPVKLNIPDYFSIISHPMDLGTIKSKLESKSYSCTEEFASDMSLTFSNAMRYNPPDNDVHIMAKELSNIFFLRWNSLEAKWKEDKSLILRQQVSKKEEKLIVNSTDIIQKTTGSSSLLARKQSRFADKQKLLKDLALFSTGTMPPKLKKFIDKIGLKRTKGGKIEVNISAVDEKTVSELQRIIKACMDEDVKHSNANSADCQHDFFKGKASHKRFKSGIAEDSLHLSASACNNFKSSTLKNSEKASDSDSDKFSVRKNNGHRNSFNLDTLDGKERKGNLPRTNTDPGFNGPGDVLVEESEADSRPMSPSVAFQEGPFEDLSPNRALRATMLRSRFAGLIVKTQQKTLLSHSEKEASVKIQKLSEQLEKQQQEERAKIVAQLKAAKASARRQAEAELKMQRQREREAARIALLKMEKTVDIYESQDILQDVEMLASTNAAIDASINGEGCSALNPLERLGLFMKHDDFEDEDI